MSYSFQVRAATAALALAAVAEKLDEVVAQQPVHAVDRDQAQAAATAFVGVLVEDEARDVVVNVSGHVSTAVVSEGAPPFVTTASCTVSASLATREEV